MMDVIDVQRFHAHKVLAKEHEEADLSEQRLKYVTDLSESFMIEVQKGDTGVSTIGVGPNCFDFLDDILLFSFFRGTSVFYDKGYNYGTREQIEVKVQSTIVSRETCAFDEDNDRDQFVEKKLKESVFVGQVHKASLDCPLKDGSSVTSLRRCPVQSRFVTMAIDALIPIPEKLDIGEAAATVATFVPAMGMLHHGRSGRNRRFSDKSLKGLDILVTGGGTDETDAVVNLALLSGANRVFVLQSKLSLASYHARSVRVELVSDDPQEWHPMIDRFMDVIVDLEYPKNFEALYRVLKNTGRMVCRKPSPNRGWLAPLHVLANELSLLRYPNASMYDVDEHIENEHGGMVRDVRYLFRLLAKRKIRPHVDRYVKLRDIQVIREDMRRKPGSGAVICEPWREHRKHPST